MAAKEALIINNNIQLILKKEKTKYIEVYYDLVKAYDMINHKWLLEVLKEYKIDNKIINIINNIMNNWRIEMKYSNSTTRIGIINLKIEY